MYEFWGETAFLYLTDTNEWWETDDDPEALMLFLEFCWLNQRTAAKHQIDETERKEMSQHQIKLR